MRRVLLFIGVVLPLAVIGAVLWPREVPDPFPCVRTSRSGWLTAASQRALVRVEWGDEPRSSATAPNDPVRWQPLSDEGARTRARYFLEPLGRRFESRNSERVSLFVYCDGHGDYWHDDGQGPTSRYRDCLLPVDESRESCVRRVWSEQHEEHESAAGALADRLDGAAGVPVFEPRIH